MTDQQIPSTAIIESPQIIWDAPLQPAGCIKCAQAFLVTSGRLGKECPLCREGDLTTQPAILRPEHPELIIPFNINKSELTSKLAVFTKGIWLRSYDFNVEHMLQRIVPVFWPLWLVDCDIIGNWKAEVGFDYQVGSSQEYYDNTNWKTREIIKTRIRWEIRTGQLIRHYDNIVAPAVSDHQQTLKIIHQYNYQQAVRYDPKLIANADLRVPDFLPDNTWPFAKTNLNKAASEECKKASEGQHIRNFTIDAVYESPNWTQLLLPMYMTYYTDDSGQVRLVHINGETGKIGGLRLASQRVGWKWAGIIAAVAAAFLFLGLLLIAGGAIAPPLAVIGAVILVIALFLGVLAIIPAVWPWQWNRKQQQ